MQEEGLASIFKRHARHRDATQAGMKAMGLPLFAPEEHGSPAITAVATKNIDAEILRKNVKENFDILLAGGQRKIGDPKNWVIQIKKNVGIPFQFLFFLLQMVNQFLILRYYI